MPSTKWTREDELRLQELLRRKERAEIEVRTPIQRKLEGMSAYGKVETDRMLESLTTEADEWRDLLKPLDSGVRDVKDPPTCRDTTRVG